MRFSSTARHDFAIKQKFRNNFFCFFASFQGVGTKSGRAIVLPHGFSKRSWKGEKIVSSLKI
jgi:hypothetical protein